MKVWTVGHSTHELDDFVALLAGHGVTAVADVRTVPRSRRHPHFDAAGRDLGAELRPAHLLEMIPQLPRPALLCRRRPFRQHDRGFRLAFAHEHDVLRRRDDGEAKDERDGPQGSNYSAARHRDLDFASPAFHRRMASRSIFSNSLASLPRFFAFTRRSLSLRRTRRYIFLATSPASSHWATS